MTISEMLQQSAILTILGMAVVFVFLWFMIICVNLVGKIISKSGLDKDTLKTETPKNANKNPEITAAITAAVTECRKEEQG
jgi:oxaloacetate decarboxylase gamma subunit